MFTAVIKMISISLRTSCGLLLAAYLFMLPQAQAAIDIVATRIWPAQDYTRLTLESKQAIRHNMFSVENPDRLVIDLEGVEPGEALNQLASKIGEDDPYIKSVRVGRFKTGVVRLLLDL